MFEQVFKNVDDIFHKDAGCSSELDDTEQSSWMLFLKYLDDLEFTKSQEAGYDDEKLDSMKEIIDAKDSDVYDLLSFVAYARRNPYSKRTRRNCETWNFE
ncbi:hypothetical protein [Vibrio lentus]|uniref:hypothetical protein n=1 Tax=Vibrio lentus TaxID=136468 RepID=UPI0039A629E5